MIRPPPRSPLFPYTTLFRSVRRARRRYDAESRRAALFGERPRARSELGLDPLSERAAVEYHSPRDRVRLAARVRDRKSTRLNSSHVRISYAVFCLKKKKEKD